MAINPIKNKNKMSKHNYWFKTAKFKKNAQLTLIMKTNDIYKNVMSIYYTISRRQIQIVAKKVHQTNRLRLKWKWKHFHTDYYSEYWHGLTILFSIDRKRRSKNRYELYNFNNCVCFDPMFCKAKPVCIYIRPVPLRYFKAT